MPAPDRPLISLNAKVYVDTAGTSLSPGSGNLLSTVGDVEIEMKRAEAKTPRRGCAYMLYRGTLVELSIKFTIVADPSDTLGEALISAFVSGTPKAFMILDNANGEGPDFDGEVLDFKRSEKLEDAVTWDFTVKPTWSGRAPAWHAATYS
jgi:hypothetical protein